MRHLFRCYTKMFYMSMDLTYRQLVAIIKVLENNRIAVDRSIFAAYSSVEAR